MMGCRRIAQIIFIVLCALIVVLFTALYGYTNNLPPNGSGPFNGSLAEKYWNQVAPVPVIFQIVWVFVIIWNVLAVLYIVISLFLPEEKSPVNVKPAIVDLKFLINYFLGFAVTTGWLFSYQREILGLSLALLTIAFLSFFTAIGAFYKTIYNSLPYMESKDKKVMLWLVRGLVQNGVGLMAAWSMALFHFSLVDILLYRNSYGIYPALEKGWFIVQNGSTVVLTLLFAFIILWFVLDRFVFEDYTRYTYTVFPVFIFTSSGLVARLRYINAERNLIFAGCMLGFSLFAFLFRIVYFFIRFGRKKKQQRSEAPPQQVEA